MGRFSRFRHIERTRSDDASPVSNGAKHDRFSRVRGPTEEGAPEAPTPGPARTFEQRRPMPEAPPESAPTTLPAPSSAAGPVVPSRPTGPAPMRPLAMADEKTRRIVGEYLASSVADRTARQFEPDVWRPYGRPVGLSLLGRIRNPRIRQAVIWTLLAIPAGVALFGGERGRRVFFYLMLLAMFAFITPRRRRWGPFGRW